MGTYTARKCKSIGVPTSSLQQSPTVAWGFDGYIYDLRKSQSIFQVYSSRPLNNRLRMANDSSFEATGARLLPTWLIHWPSNPFLKMGLTIHFPHEELTIPEHQTSEDEFPNKLNFSSSDSIGQKSQNPGALWLLWVRFSLENFLIG